MGLEIRRNQDGTLKRVWRGRYKLNGNRPCPELCPIKGKPPASWRPEAKTWPISDKGDELFEASRAEAEKLLAEKKKEARRLQAVSPETTFALVMSDKLGKKYKVAKISELAAIQSKSDVKTVRSKEKNKNYESWLNSTLPTFTKWWITTKHRSNDPLTIVTRADAADFANFLCSPSDDGKKRSADTINRRIKFIRAVFRKALPPGAPNPFDDILIDRIDGDEVIHREPLDNLDDINLLLETAKKTDTLTYYLATVGIYTALRKGDLCELRWSDIHLTNKWIDDQGIEHLGTIDRVLNKTKVMVHIPMFPPLKDLMDLVFTEKRGDSEYVFPEAARLYAASRIIKKNLPPDQQDKFDQCGNDTLSKNLKYVYAKAFAEKKGLLAIDSATETIELKDVIDEIKSKMTESGIGEKKRSRIFQVLDAYASGKAFNEIAAELKLNKSQIHYDLKKAEDSIAPRKFIRNRKNLGPSKDQLIKAVTCRSREVGAHAASIYDFPALRTTFVTIARSAGMTLDDIRCITGHADTKMLEQFYDRTRGVAIAKRFTKAAPAFFRPEETKTEVLESATPALPDPSQENGRLPALDSKEDLLRYAKGLEPKKRKQFLKQLMLVQQALIEADE